MELAPSLEIHSVYSERNPKGLFFIRTALRRMPVIQLSHVFACSDAWDSLFVGLLAKHVLAL